MNFLILYAVYTVNTYLFRVHYSMINPDNIQTITGQSNEKTKNNAALEWNTMLPALYDVILVFQ